LPVGDLGGDLAQRLSAGSTSIAPYSASIESRICTTRIEKPQRGASGTPS